jgi:hypothetical protein
MPAPPLLPRLYLLNSALLVTHEIDSGYWREWELFGVPGGSQFFLVLNLALILVRLHGHGCVVRSAPSGKVYSWLLVGGGLFAGTVHGWFLLAGSPRFRQPASLILLGAILLVSLCQAMITRRWRTGI